MFDIDKIVRYFALLCHLGLIATSIDGFIIVGKSMDVTILMISIVCHIFGLFLFVIEFQHVYLFNLFKSYSTIYFLRSIQLFVFALIIIGISEITLCFAIFFLFNAFMNGFMGLFTLKTRIINIEHGSQQINNMNSMNHRNNPYRQSIRSRDDEDIRDVLLENGNEN